MTQRDREREARRCLYRYVQDKRDVEEYEAAVFGSPKHDESGVRGTEISDPTARLGIALAEPPSAIVRKKRWIAAIEDALAELYAMDAGDDHGFAYICIHTFGLDGQRHKRRENRDTAIKIASDCSMSVRAMYYRLSVTLNVVIYHATEHGCFGK